MEIVSDVLVSVGCLVIVAALAVVWWPLGLLALGLGLVALGFVFFVKAKAVKAAKRDNS